jgi:thiosulfate/3-mercaptopyruvate sulfurtransferase
LSEHLDDPDLVVLECNVHFESNADGDFAAVSGRELYEGGHIPTAGFADLMGDLSDGNSELQFAVPTPEAFSAAMEALGVGDETRVVLYDRYGAGWAARVWWMLRWIGFDRAALLDGGFAAWVAEDRPLSTEPAGHPPGRLTVALRPGLIADRDEVAAAVGDSSIWLVDAMPAAHYRGEMVLYGRPGHIPGASNIPALDLLDEAGRFRPLDELASLHGRDPADHVITYCGGGISASASAFVLTRLGYEDVAVYTASLQEWAADPELPLETITP